MWAVLLILAITTLLYAFRPSAIYRRKVLAEYQAWRGRALGPADQDLRETLKMMKKQGLSPREARIVLCTYVDYGILEASKHLSAVLSGEKYQAPTGGLHEMEKDASSVIHRGVKSLSGQKATGVVVDIESFANFLRNNLDNEIRWNTGNFKSMSAQALTPPPSLSFEVECLLFFAFDFAISSGPEVDLRNNLHKAFLDTGHPSESEQQQIVARCKIYAALIAQGAGSHKPYEPLGKAFAEYVGNKGNALVIIWGIETFKTMYIETCSKIDAFILRIQ